MILYRFSCVFYENIKKNIAFIAQVDVLKEIVWFCIGFCSTKPDRAQPVHRRARRDVTCQLPKDVGKEYVIGVYSYIILVAEHF